MVITSHIVPVISNIPEAFATPRTYQGTMLPPKKVGFEVSAGEFGHRKAGRHNDDDIRADDSDIDWLKQHSNSLKKATEFTEDTEITK